MYRRATQLQVHVVPGRRIPVSAAVPWQDCCRVSVGTGIRLEAHPVHVDEPSTIFGRGSANVAFAGDGAASPIRWAPRRGMDIAAAVTTGTTSPGTALMGASSRSVPRYFAKRHVSTANSAAAKKGDDPKHASRRASDGNQQTSTPSLSLQGLLGISDGEAKVIRTMEQTTKTGFGNLIAGIGGYDGRDRDRGGLDADHEIKEEYPPRSPPPCFPRYLVDQLGAKPENVKSLVLRRPLVLGWSAGATAKVSRWLQQNLGMRRSEVARLLLKNPEAATKAIESDIEPNVEWLRDNLNPRDAGGPGVIKFLLRVPAILNLSAERSLEPTLRWLQGRLRISREDAAKIARENPKLFWLSLEDNVEPTLTWLREKLKIEDEDVILGIVTTAPRILTLNIRTVLEPNLDWLHQRSGMTPQEVYKRVADEPTTLYKSVVDKFELKLAWVTTNLKVDDEAARKMLVTFPWIVGASLCDNVELTLPWLHEAVGLDGGEAVDLVKRAPVLLAYSTMGNLDPTASFFLVEMGASPEELRDAVVGNPRVLSYSLNRRLRPRVARMRMLKIQPCFSRHRYHVVFLPDYKFQKYLDQNGWMLRS